VKTLVVILSMMLCSVALGQDNAIANDSPRLRCGKAALLAWVLQQSPEMNNPPEILPADVEESCRLFMVTLDHHDDDKSQQALVHAKAALDRSNLSTEELALRLARAVNSMEPTRRFSSLKGLAQEVFDLGDLDQAKVFARQLLQEAPHHPNGDGNAIYYGNSVLGLVALHQGDVQLAEQYLLASANTPGSPQLPSFGPNVTLAKELLEKGERPVVLQFFALCKNFWKNDHGKLEEWSAAVRSGVIPQFAQNLNY
jgi:hypothetical protein